MTRNVSRRRFVQSTLAAGALTAAAAPRAHVRVGLYSITYGGVWYRGDALTVEQVIGRASKFGYQGVEIDGKRPTAIRSTCPRLAASRSASSPPIKASRSTPLPATTISTAPSPSIARPSWFTSATSCA